MQVNTIYIEQLKKQLSELNPYLVLLFGSYAYGTPDQDSDIDLLVVTNDEYMPTSFREKTELYMKVNEYIRETAKEVAIDLIVHTKPMYQKFIELNSSFSKEILSKGVILYEGNNKGVA